MATGPVYASYATGVGIVAIVVALACGAPELRAKLCCCCCSCCRGDGLFHFDKLRAVHLVQDTRGLGPLRFGLLRLAFGLFALGTTAQYLPENPYLLTTFTGWSWFLLGVYFVMMGIISLRERALQPDAVPSDNSVTKLHCFLWVWFQIMTACAVFICLIVWFVLIPLDWVLSGFPWVFFDFYNLSAHNANVVLMFIELYLNRMTFLKAHAVFVILYASSYIIFAWWWHSVADMFWYIFLDWDLLGYFTPLAYVGLAAMLYGMFLGVACLSVCLKRGVPHEGFPTEEGAPAADQQPQEIPLAAAS